MIELFVFMCLGFGLIFVLALLPRIDKPYWGFIPPKVKININNLEVDKNGNTNKKECWKCSGGRLLGHCPVCGKGNR